MRGTIAKRLRKKVWGLDGSPRARQHFVARPIKKKGGKVINGGFCIADQKRRLYQALKREHREHRL
jgi:hypothetical protein